MRDTLSGLVDVGGNDVGGRAMFCAQPRTTVSQHACDAEECNEETYQLEFGLSSRRDAYRLHALLARHFIVEAQERLVRLHALAALCLSDLEGQLQYV